MSVFKMIPIGFLVLFMAGCGGPTQATLQNTPDLTEETVDSSTATSSPSTPAATAQPTAVSELTKESVKNAEYRLNAANTSDIVQFSDGKYETGSGADYVSVSLAEPVLFVDLNRDQVKDAVTIAGENYGGTGVFTYLVVFINEDGKPVHSYSKLIDDRPIINALKLDKESILLDAVIHGSQDAMCCPTFPIVRLYRLTKSGLTSIREVSKTSDGAERSITIVSPVNGDEVSGSVNVKGTVTIAPFENNLVYTIFDDLGNELVKGPFPVNAEELGGPGTFDNPIDLSSIPSGSIITLEISDMSMLDGSTLAMDSVELTVK